MKVSFLRRVLTKVGFYKPKNTVGISYDTKDFFTDGSSRFSFFEEQENDESRKPIEIIEFHFNEIHKNIDNRRTTPKNFGVRFNEYAELKFADDDVTVIDLVDFTDKKKNVTRTIIENVFSKNEALKMVAIQKMSKRKLRLALENTLKNRETQMNLKQHELVAREQTIAEKEYSLDMKMQLVDLKWKMLEESEKAIQEKELELDFFDPQFEKCASNIETKLLVSDENDKLYPEIAEEKMREVILSEEKIACNQIEMITRNLQFREYVESRTYDLDEREEQIAIAQQQLKECYEQKIRELNQIAKFVEARKLNLDKREERFNFREINIDRDLKNARVLIKRKMEEIQAKNKSIKLLQVQITQKNKLIDLLTYRTSVGESPHHLIGYNQSQKQAMEYRS